MLICTHADCLEHRVPMGHPERPDRLRSVLAHFDQTGIGQDAEIRTAPLVDMEHVARVHAQPYLATVVELLPGEGMAQLDADTHLSPQSQLAARRAAGAVVDATRAVLAREASTAFCAVRPPGHHAESDAGMGFCVYNSVAVAAAWALTQPGIERVAILDFDVHHANGTVEIFEDDPRVLVCSSFQHPFYPGRYDDVSKPHIVLTPLEAGSDGNVFRRAIDRDWLPAIEAHAPQVVFVSAGFDAHKADPLGGLGLDESDYTWVTEQIVALAADHAAGRIVSTLEGGYDLDALARSAYCHVAALST